MPVAVRRAVIARTGTAEAAGSEQRNARSDRRGAEALDVISVSPVPDGPFGRDLRYVGLGERVNGLVHELRLRTGQSIHEFTPSVDESVDNLLDHPPIANISIRGRLEVVASVRSSE
jgi:hypothetical protein